jgi:hypothetical protein
MAWPNILTRPGRPAGRLGARVAGCGSGAVFSRAIDEHQQAFLRGSGCAGEVTDAGERPARDAGEAVSRNGGFAASGCGANTGGAQRPFVQRYIRAAMDLVADAAPGTGKTVVKSSLKISAGKKPNGAVVTAQFLDNRRLDRCGNLFVLNREGVEGNFARIGTLRLRSCGYG